MTSEEAADGKVQGRVVATRLRLAEAEVAAVVRRALVVEEPALESVLAGQGPAAEPLPAPQADGAPVVASAPVRCHWPRR